MNIILIFLFSVFSNFVFGSFEVFNKALESELLEMVEKDQNLRIQWINAHDSVEEDILKQAVVDVDDLHLIRLKEII